MARAKKTPSIGLSGIYTALTPFILQNAFTYQCIAIRRFLDVEKENIKVYETFYEPVGLSEEVYAEDDAMDACIITLRRSDGYLVYIPDTFILSYPLLEGQKYVRMSMLVDCGIVRDTLDVEFVKNQIISLVREVVNPPSTNVDVVLLPVKNSLSVADQDTLEAIRIANVEMHKTDYAKYKALEIEVNNLRAIIDSQNQKMIDAGIPN